MPTKEKRPFLQPHSPFWLVNRLLAFNARMESSGASTIALSKAKNQLRSGGIIVVDAHLLRPECRRRQIADILFSAKHLHAHTNPDRILLPAAGNFFHHPLAHPWIRSHREDKGQVLMIAPVYSRKRDSLGHNYSTIGHNSAEMEQRNVNFHDKAHDLLTTPRSIILLSPFAGTQPLGKASDMPQRVLNLMQAGSNQLYASLSWLRQPRTFITAFSPIDESFLTPNRQRTTNNLNEIFNTLFDLTQN